MTLSGASFETITGPRDDLWVGARTQRADMARLAAALPGGWRVEHTVRDVHRIALYDESGLFSVSRAVDLSDAVDMALSALGRP